MQSDSSEVANGNEGPNGLSKKCSKEEVFNCECGKGYSSFSALFLHVKFKHDKRLTPKQAESNHRVQEINNKKVYTYFLKQPPKDQISQYNNPKSQQEIKVQSEPLPRDLNNSDIINKFLQDCEKNGKSMDPPFTTYKIILRGFMDYLDQLQKVRSSDPEAQIPDDIILLLNQFVVYYVADIRKNTSLASFRRQKIIKVMFQFGRWLKRKGLTEYTVALNEEESNNRQK